MITHVPFEDLDERHVTALAKSLTAAPESQRPEGDSFLRAIMLGTMRLFEFPRGYILVGQTDKRLVVYAFAVDNLLGLSTELAADIKRLAADWECDMIETTVFDPRLTSAIRRIGGRVESQTLVLPVE